MTTRCVSNSLNLSWLSLFWTVWPQLSLTLSESVSSTVSLKDYHLLDLYEEKWKKKMSSYYVPGTIYAFSYLILLIIWWGRFDERHFTDKKIEQASKHLGSTLFRTLSVFAELAFVHCPSSCCCYWSLSVSPPSWLACLMPGHTLERPVPETAPPPSSFSHDHCSTSLSTYTYQISQADWAFVFRDVPAPRSIGRYRNGGQKRGSECGI